MLALSAGRRLSRRVTAPSGGTRELRARALGAASGWPVWSPFPDALSLLGFLGDGPVWPCRGWQLWVWPSHPALHPGRHFGLAPAERLAGPGPSRGCETLPGESPLAFGDWGPRRPAARLCPRVLGVCARSPLSGEQRGASGSSGRSCRDAAQRGAPGPPIWFSSATVAARGPGSVRS